MDIVITPINLGIFLLIINSVSLLVMSFDKAKSRHNQRRVSEKNLFLLALLGGGVGIYVAMYLFRHKTKKWYFTTGVPVIILGEGYLLFRLFFS
jgi:uncharacterized membrane protein YsdA (DUF1294 family)